MFINDKIMFDLYYCINSTNIAKMKKILAQYSKYELVTFSNAIMLCTIRAAVEYS